MTRITLTDDRAGLADFPAGFIPAGRDDCGDPLAVDDKGRVLRFSHGSGDWSHRTLAFASLQELQRFVESQSRLIIPPDEGLPESLQRKADLESLARAMRRSPLARAAVREALADVRELITDARFRASKRGRSIELRQRLGQECERALQAAGAPGTWMVRAHVERPDTICVIGPLSAPWDEAGVRALLEPLVGDHRLLLMRGP